MSPPKKNKFLAAPRFAWVLEPSENGTDHDGNSKHIDRSNKVSK